MAFLGDNGVQVAEITPMKYAAEVPTTTAISIRFSTDIASNDEQSLAAAIKIRETESGASVPGQFSYSSKVVTFVPSSPLSTNTNYTITIIAGRLYNAAGDTLLVNYTSSFTTAAAESPIRPTLLEPADNSISSVVPTFKWTQVADSYEIEIAYDESFGSIAVRSSGIVGDTFTPVDLVLNRQYYWRVRGSNNGQLGDWSIARTFYYGVHVEQSYVAPTYLTPTPLSVLSVAPEPGECLVSIDTNTIMAYFSETLEESSAQALIRYKSLEDNPVNVSGIITPTVSVNNNILVMSLAEPLLQNTEYTVTIMSGVAGVSGSKTTEEIKWSFTTTMIPYYTSVELIRLDIGPFIQQFSDNIICKTIYDVSKHADKIAGKPFSSETQANFWCYTRYATGYRLLNRAIMDMATTQGENVRLGDFNIRKDGSLVPDINMAMKWVRDEMETCERRLRIDNGVARPTSATRSGSASPYPFGQRRF